MKEETVNIIIIGYNIPKLERVCIKSIHANTSHPYLLTYFNNFSSGMTLTQAWNKFIGWSPCRYICLLNNDTEVSPGWLTLLYGALGKEVAGKRIGFVGPSTSSCHSRQKEIATQEEALKHKGEIEIMDQPISGFCLLFAKSTWSSLNGFDERYGLYGQESDFIDRAKEQLALECAWRKDAFVYHQGEASIKAHAIDVVAERKKARDIYWRDRG